MGCKAEGAVTGDDPKRAAGRNAQQLTGGATHEALHELFPVAV